VNVKRESLRENILAAQVEAAMRGHELGAFEAVDEPGRAKYQAFLPEVWKVGVCE
jgi:hypothetical protein